MALTEKAQELIGKLPAELQPFAGHYIDLLQRFTMDEIRGIISLSVEGNSQAAYAALVAKMSKDELLVEIARLNSVMDDLIANAKAETEYLKNFLNIAIAIGLSAM